MTKQELRKAIRAVKARQSDEQLRQLSEGIVARLLSLPQLVKAHTVAAYASLPDEVCTATLLQQLLLAGKTVLLPKVTGSETMELRQYCGPNDMQEGAFHIMEPSGAVVTDYSHIDLVIVPGMAFTADGARLGRGRGYYDRFISQLPKTAVRVGLCFPFQLVEHIPSEAHDQKMDIIISDPI